MVEIQSVLQPCFIIIQVGLITGTGGTLISNGITTVHTTRVFGTYNNGGDYAQIVQSTAKVFEDDFAAIAPTAAVTRGRAEPVTELPSIGEPINFAKIFFGCRKIVNIRLLRLLQAWSPNKTLGSSWPRLRKRRPSTTSRRGSSLASSPSATESTATSLPGGRSTPQLRPPPPRLEEGEPLPSSKNSKRQALLPTDSGREGSAGEGEQINKESVFLLWYEALTVLTRLL